MIKEIDELLAWWGSAFRTRRIETGIRCALSFDGQPRAPRGLNSGLERIYDIELDKIATQVDLAVSRLSLPVSKGGLGERAGNELKKLARTRYLTNTEPTIEQQLKRLGYKTKHTYFVKLDQLHHFVQKALNLHDHKTA